MKKKNKEQGLMPITFFLLKKQDIIEASLDAQIAVRASATNTSHTLVSQLKHITEPDNLHQKVVNQSYALCGSLTIKQRDLVKLKKNVILCIADIVHLRHSTDLLW